MTVKSPVPALPQRCPHQLHQHCLSALLESPGSPSVTLLNNCLIVMNSFAIHCDNVNQGELIESSHCTCSLGTSTTIQELINGPVIFSGAAHAISTNGRPGAGTCSQGWDRVPAFLLLFPAVLLLFPALHTLFWWAER